MSTSTVAITDSPSDWTLDADSLSCVFDILASEDEVRALKACSLACKTFHSLCMRHIFATIDVDRFGPYNHSRDTVFGNIKCLLDRNPRVGTYVKTLNLFVKFTQLDNPDIPYILTLLPNVAAFILSFESTRHGIIWDTIPPSLQACLEGYIRSSRLTSLKLVNLQLPLRSICSPLHTLRNLELSYKVKPSVREGRALQRPATLPQLYSFSTGLHCSDGARQLLGGHGMSSIFDFSMLSSLSMRRLRTEADFKVMEEFLNTVLAVRTLELEAVPTVFDPIIGHFRFAECLQPSSKKTLRHLKLLFKISREYEDPYCGACDELKILASAESALETICLEITVEMGSVCSTEKEIWGKLVNVVTLSNFPLLHQVTIHVGIEVQGNPTDWRDDLDDSLRNIGNELSEIFKTRPSIKFAFRITLEL